MSYSVVVDMNRAFPSHAARSGSEGKEMEAAVAVAGVGIVIAMVIGDEAVAEMEAERAGKRSDSYFVVVAAELDWGKYGQGVLGSHLPI